MASAVATSTSLNADLLFREFSKIIQFREDIVSGSHPRVKLPAHPTKQNNNNVFRPGQSQSQGHVSSTTVERVPPSSSASQQHQPLQKNGVNGHKKNNVGSFQANSQHPVPSAGGRPKPAPATEPVLPEKPEDPRNAAIRGQRQRIEAELRQEVEQRRGKLQSPDEMADFDLSEVLMKALERVKAASLPALAERSNAAAGNASPSSDSFDNNTFYSSHHDTPESSNSARQQHQSDNDDVQMLGDDSYEPQISPDHLYSYPTAPRGPASQRPSGSQQYTMSGALMAQANVAAQPIEVRSSQESGEASGSRDSNSNGTDQNADRQNLRRRGLQPAFEPRDPQLVRAHNLSPVAPQPAHISTLAMSGDLQMSEQGGRMPQGTPAQVVALRGEASGPYTSPDSSPQTGTTKTDKKKNKKKKRKAERQVPEPLSPFIKPEPRSPSPVAAPAYSRPSKRQRHSGGPRQIQDLTYDEPRYEQVEPAQPERYPSRQYREERYTVAYEDPRRPAASVVHSPRIEQAFGDERLPATLVRPARSSAAYVQYADPPPQRSASRAGQAFYREIPQDEARVTGRPEAGRDRSRSPVMGPPRPARIIIDQYGREYIEPPRPTVIRQSVAPVSRHGEPEVIYERTVPHEATRRPEAFDDGGIVFTRRASPTYNTVPRRVITQPEFAPPTEYRSYRQREYSARPSMGATEEFVMRAPIERRFEEAPPREYITRAASVRPAATEPVRYEMARDYGRVQSVRPDMQVREFPSGGPPPPDGRRSVIQQPIAREYGSHPNESQVIRQEYIRPTEERYYESRPVRGGEEIAFIERPRGATQEIVYADNGHREVYR